MTFITTGYHGWPFDKQSKFQRVEYGYPDIKDELVFEDFVNACKAIDGLLSNSALANHTIAVDLIDMSVFENEAIRKQVYLIRDLYDHVQELHDQKVRSALSNSTKDLTEQIRGLREKISEEWDNYKMLIKLSCPPPIDGWLPASIR